MCFYCFLATYLQYDTEKSTMFKLLSKNRRIRSPRKGL